MLPPPGEVVPQDRKGFRPPLNTSHSKSALLPPPGEVVPQRRRGASPPLSASSSMSPMLPPTGEVVPQDRKGFRPPLSASEPSPRGKVSAQQTDEGPRNTSSSNPHCAVPHPALPGHPPPRGGHKHPLHGHCEGAARGNPFPSPCFQKPRPRNPLHAARVPFLY